VTTLDKFDRDVVAFVGERWQVRWMDDDASRVFGETHAIEAYQR